MGSPRSSRSRGSTAEDLRRLAHALPGVVETLTWGAPHFRVRDRIFAGIGMREGRAVTSVKLQKSHAEALVQESHRLVGKGKAARSGKK